MAFSSSLLTQQARASRGSNVYERFTGSSFGERGSRGLTLLALLASCPCHFHTLKERDAQQTALVALGFSYQTINLCWELAGGLRY